MQRRAVFRVGLGGSAGGGHAMRCLSLADELVARGWACCFSSPGPLNALRAFHSRPGIQLQQIPAGDLDIQVAALARDCDLLVVDDYALDAQFETRCRPWARHIMVIDDLNGRAHDCDTLLNSALGWTAKDYATCVPPGSRILLGPRYALLPRDARLARGARYDARRSVRRVVVGMGLTDTVNATSFALSAVAAALPRARVDVIVSSACPHLATIRRRLARWRQRRLHLDSLSPVTVMGAADLAIGGAGVTAWERCCLGLPSVMLVLADNQARIAAAIAARGAGLVVGRFGTVSRHRVGSAARSLASSPRVRHRMSRQAASLCDGLGARRVADILTTAAA